MRSWNKKQKKLSVSSPRCAFIFPNAQSILCNLSVFFFGQPSCSSLITDEEDLCSSQFSKIGRQKLLSSTSHQLMCHKKNCIHFLGFESLPNIYYYQNDFLYKLTWQRLLNVKINKKIRINSFIFFYLHIGQCAVIILFSNLKIW